MAAAPAESQTHTHPHTAHPVGVYFQVWGWLFLLSTLSYLVDYFHVQSYLRWTLILILMAAKAGLIVAFFMHLKWERLALKYTILVPPLALLVLVGLMLIEGDHTFFTRMTFFG